MATNSGGRGPRFGPDSILETNEIRDVRRRVGQLATDISKRQCSAQADSTAVLLATLVADFNALLAKLRAAKLMKP